MISHASNSKLFLLFFFICTTCLCLSSGSQTDEYSYSVMGPNLDRLPSPEETIELFRQWVKEYGRHYNSLDELKTRFDTFVDNLKYISRSNAARKASSYRLGLNQFADWSHEEFEEVLLHDDVEPPPPDHERIVLQENVTAFTQTSLDWRQRGVVTPVKNQGSCGSCWAFAAAAAIECMHALSTGSLIRLSEQELLDCDNVSNGCSGGWTIRAYDWVIANGIASEANYPYRAVKGSCRASQIPRSATMTRYIGYLQRSDQALLSATLSRPISVSTLASDWQHYKSGIFDGPNCEPNGSRTNHAVLIVGFGTSNGQDYWIVKNSWGSTWGMSGYIWIKRNSGFPNGVCALNVRAAYPIRTSLTDASPDGSISAM